MPRQQISSKKKGGGGGGGLLGALGKTAGIVGGALGGLQQATFRTGSALGAALHGRGKEALGELGKGGLELATLGQAKGDIGFSEAAALEGQTVRLPKGLETLANVGLDPFLVGGATRKGAKGVSALADVTGLTRKQIAKNIATKGLPEKGRHAIIANLIDQGVAADKAVKIAAATARTGGRGAAKTALGETIQQAGAAKKEAIRTSAFGQKMGRLTEGLRPGAEAAREFGSKDIADEVRGAASRASAEAATKVDNAINELANAAEATKARLGRNIDDADEAKMYDALEEGPEGLSRLVRAEPGYAPFLQAADRNRHVVTTDQLRAGVLGRDTTAAAAKAGEAADEAVKVVNKLDQDVEKFTQKAKAQRAAATKKARLIERARAAGDMTADEARAERARVTALHKSADKFAKQAEQARSARRAAKLDLRKAEKAASGTPGGLRGVRDTATYLQRLPTAETTEAVRKGSRSLRSIRAGDEPGDLVGGIHQAAENARSIFPKFPVTALNFLKAAVDEGEDVMQVITDTPALRNLVQGMDPKMLESQIKEFETLAKALPEGAQIYKQSTLESLINRTASAYRAIAGKQFADELAQMTDADGAKLMLSEDDIQEGAKFPADWIDVDIPKVGKFKTSKALADEVNKVMRIAGRDQFTEDFDKAMGAWQTFWKAHATVGMTGSIPFAARNTRSNIWLMMTRGGMGPQHVAGRMKEAWDLDKKVRKITGQAKIGRRFTGDSAEQVAKEGIDSVLRQQLTKHEYEMWTEMQKRNITRGFFDVEFGETAADVARKIKGEKRAVKGGILGHVLSPKGAVIETGRDLNSVAEQNARMAMFIHAYDETGSFDDAERLVKDTLFDYEDLTAFERKRAKAVLPFYTFMRKNIQAQAHTLANSPYRIALPENISEAVTEDLPEDAPDYLKQAGSRQIPAFLPLLGKGFTTPDRPIQAAAQPFAPLISLAQGKGKEAARGVANIPGGAQLDLLMALSELGTGKDTFTGANVDPGVREFITRLLTSQVPSLNRLPRTGGLEEVPNRDERPLPTEILKLLSGLNVTRPKQ